MEYFVQNKSGKITSRDLIIVGGITGVVAIVIIALFIVISGKQNQTNRNNATQQLIDQIKQQSLNKNGIPTNNQGQIANDEENNFDPQAIHLGQLIELIPGVEITIKTQTTDETININQKTVVKHENNTLPLSSLSLGDVLQVSVERVRFGPQTATEIIIMRSTSPTIPQNISEPTFQPPPISTRPVSPY
jgi:hypothetical protein